MKAQKFLRLNLILLFLLHCASDVQKKVIGEDVVGDNVKPQNFQKIAPLTANALGERKISTRRDGISFPSSKKSTKTVIENGAMSFRTAKAMVFVSMKERAEKYPGNLGDTMKMIRSLGKMKKRLSINSVKTFTKERLILQNGNWSNQGNCLKNLEIHLSLAISH
jgi:hypothetical protein